MILKIPAVRWDWSLIELASDVGNADHVLPLSRRIPPDGTMLMVGGYAQEHPNVLTADLDCRVTGSFVDSQGRRLIRHNCATSRGVSGAPLLVRTETGWSIVGINVAQAKDGANGFAVALGEWPAPCSDTSSQVRARPGLKRLGFVVQPEG